MEPRQWFGRLSVARPAFRGEDRAMTYSGHVENGQVVFDATPGLPDGTPAVVSVAATAGPLEVQEDREIPTLYEQTDHRDRLGGGQCGVSGDGTTRAADADSTVLIRSLRAEQYALWTSTPTCRWLLWPLRMDCLSRRQFFSSSGC